MTVCSFPASLRSRLVSVQPQLPCTCGCRGRWSFGCARDFLSPRQGEIRKFGVMRWRRGACHRLFSASLSEAESHVGRVPLFSGTRRE
jgi:hypothetical protein